MPTIYHELTGPPEATTVVLANSLGSTLAMWDPQVAALSTLFRVLRFDLPGHGRSPVSSGPCTVDELAGDLLGLLDRLDVPRAHVVGLSLGGMVALRLAARAPERVDRLAVLCTSALLGPAQGWRDRAALVRAEGTSAVAEAVVARWFTPAFAAAEPGRIKAAEAMVSSVSPEGYAACCEAIAEMDLTDDLAQIDAPTLAIAGADDPATPPGHLERIATGVKDGRLLVVRHAAHLANVEQPLAVTEALVQHLVAS